MSMYFEVIELSFGTSWAAFNFMRTYVPRQCQILKMMAARRLAYSSQNDRPLESRMVSIIRGNFCLENYLV
jgi:hypothetical protein